MWPDAGKAHMMMSGLDILMDVRIEFKKAELGRGAGLIER